MTEASVTSVVEVDIKGGPTPHAPPSRADPGDVPKTSTKEMMAIFFISIGGCVFSLLALIGYFNICVTIPDVGQSQLPGGVGDTLSNMIAGGSTGDAICRPITGFGFGGVIVLLISIITFPTAVGTCVAMFTHWKPAQVLIGSKQCTDQLRAKISKPFQMKYLHTIQCIFQAIAFIIALIVVSGTTFPWGCIMSLLASICYGVNIALVFRHFKQPGVPQSLNLGFGEAGEQIVASQKASDSKVASIEKRVADLEAKVKLLMEKA